MKTLKQLSIVLAGLLLVIACQKELSFETGSLTGGVAAGVILKDSTGNCLPVTINGTYKDTTTLTDSNYVSIQVNITSPGLYKIFTDTQNGFSFQDSGYATVAGVQTIKLKGSGKPILPMPTNFTVAFSTSFCSFTVNVNASAGGTSPAAAFTLSGAPGSCTGATAAGTYKVGTALNSTNTVPVSVNVTTAGTYTITTTPVNGMGFGATGVFTSTGVQTVTLTGFGTPATAGTSTFPITAGGTTCSFTVTVAAATSGGTTPTAADSAWSFNQGSGFYYGRADTAYAEVITGLGTVFTFLGTSYATHDSAIQIDILLPSTTITPGTYNTATSADFYFYKSSDTSVVYYTAEPGATVNVAVTISSYDATTKIVTGTFTGTAFNASGVSVPITNGKFKGKVQ